jgi:hypothetical protein
MSHTLSAFTISTAREGFHGFQTARRGGAASVRLGGAAPRWLTELVIETHREGTMPPDDWRHRFTRDALLRIANTAPGRSRDDLCSDIEADTDGRDLINWLGSHVSRLAYCDEALEQGECDSTWQLISDGQIREKREVFGVVWAMLLRMGQ